MEGGREKKGNSERKEKEGEDERKLKLKGQNKRKFSKIMGKRLPRESILR